MYVEEIRSRSGPYDRGLPRDEVKTLARSFSKYGETYKRRTYGVRPDTRPLSFLMSAPLGTHTSQEPDTHHRKVGICTDTRTYYE